MADAYWRYTGDRQQSAVLVSQLAKRPRSNNEIHSGLGISSYYALEDERGEQHVVRDTDSINASYDCYLRSAKISHGWESGRSVSVGLGGLPHVDDPRTSPMGGSDPVVVANDLSMGLGGRSNIPLPPDASGTLFVEGLPANCTRREVAHIFRPFVGYKEVRLVNKGSRHSGGDPLVLCFVDFQSPAHAATAMDALKDCCGAIGPSDGETFTKRMFFKGTRFEYSLNPGPFNIKEHVMITMLANAGAGSVYATHILSAVKLYYKKSLGFIPAFILMMTTQLLGFGWAGIFRKHLVEPGVMWWPGNLVQVSLFM